MTQTRLVSSLILVACLQVCSVAVAADWPQWFGPNRDGQSSETGALVSTWTQTGPPVRWTRPLGAGFSSISVVGDTGYTMATVGSHVAIVAFDVATGKDRWQTRIGPKYDDRMGGDGPRATPTIDGNHLFTLGPSGALVAMNRTSGRLLWMRQIAQEFGGKIPKWGYSASPLVANGMVYLDVGGENDHGIMAFSRKDGSVAWHKGSFKAGYSSPALLTLAGTPQVVFFTAQAAVATRPKDGEVLWKRPWKISYDVSAATPIAVGPNAVFIAAGYGVGGVLYDVRKSGETFEAIQRWATPKMRNKMSTSVAIGGVLYGFDEERLTAMHAATGEIAWQRDDFGRGSLISAGPHLIVLGEDCRLVIVKATPSGYEPLKPPATVLKSERCWTVPTLANGVLYIRDLEQMTSLDLVKR